MAPHVTAGLVVAFLLGPMLGWQPEQCGAFATEPSATAARVPTLAVVDMVDRGPSVELAVLRTALAEMLVGDLSQYEGLRVVERVRVSHFLQEANLQAGFTEGAAVRRAAEVLAADYLLVGSFQSRDETLTVDFVLRRVDAAKPVAAWRQTAPVAKLDELEREAVQRTLAALKIERPVRRSAPPPKKARSPLVVVVGLRNLSPSPRLTPMESGFADILQANLSAIEGVRLVDRDQLYAVLREQGLAISGMVRPETALEIGKLMGAERMIYGSFVEFGANLRIDVRLADAKSAAVLAAQAISGPTEEFSGLLEKLALGAAAQLAVEPAHDAAQRLKAAAPTRNIEAAIHLANADRAYHTTRYGEAAQHYERALLVEPNNGQAAMERIRALYLHRDYARGIEAGRQALSNPGLPVTSPYRETAYGWLSNCQQASGDVAATAKTEQRLIAERAISGYDQRKLESALRLAQAGQYDEALALVRDPVAEERRAQSSLMAYAFALHHLNAFLTVGASYVRGSPRFWSQVKDPAERKRLSQITRSWAEQSIEVRDEILREAERRPSYVWRFSASELTHLRPGYLDESGALRDLTNDQQHAALLVRMLRVFAHSPPLCWRAQRQLADIRWKASRWDLALESCQYLLAHPEDDTEFGFPMATEWKIGLPAGTLNECIRARWRIAEILYRHNNQRSEATAAYQQLLRENGSNHAWGMATTRALEELGQEPPPCSNAALVWGGNFPTHLAYQALLRPLGITTHAADMVHLSLAEMAPYRLVVIARWCNHPFTPADALAVRSYVANGGSLLVIASPGWEPAQPGIVNPLLSFFGMQAGQDMAVRAPSTQLLPHPITKGIGPLIAKNAVDLQVPPAAVLIRADQRRVLAASEYRGGRVVVASLGQWFLPDSHWKCDGGTRFGSHWSYQLPLGDLPYEPKQERLYLPLLRNVLTWLARIDEDWRRLREERRPLLDAESVALRVQYGMRSLEDLCAAMDRWIARVPAGVAREEALWAAGEALLQLPYRDVGGSLIWSPNAFYPSPAAKAYFERLLREFPDSLLRSYAAWRIGDYQRRWAMRHDFGSRDAREVVAAFEKVTASPGSYAWAWTELGLGSAYFWAKDYAAAAPHFQRVADRIESSAEKSLGVLNAAACEEALHRFEEARRGYQAGVDLPKIIWWSPSYHCVWEPLDFVNRHRSAGKTTQQIAESRLHRLPKGHAAQ